MNLWNNILHRAHVSFGVFLFVACFLFVAYEAPSMASVSVPAEKLVIISPHRKSIQDEFVPAFKKYYQEKYQREITVDWIDQGGTENNLRYVQAKYKGTPATSGVDVFWGGGDVVFTDLENAALLEAYPLPADLAKEIPQRAAGVELHSKSNKWHATALSSFGIFYNKPLLARLKLPEPRSWEDLADPRYYDLISLADPRHSATSLFMQMLMLYSEGWDKGWQNLAALAGNARSFTHSSSDPIKAVVSGDAAIATAIDFYAYAKVAELGQNALGFVLPAGKTVVNADPIGILKGASNTLQAQRFIQFVLSSKAQKLFILPKGHPDGPKYAVLGRLPVNPQAFATLADPKLAVTSNPFLLGEPTFQVDIAKLSRLDNLLSDLFGAIHIDNHQHYKKTWALILKTKGSEALKKAFGAPPLSEAELWTYADKWSDNVFRNQTINSWVQAAKTKDAGILRGIASLEQAPTAVSKR